MKKIIDGDVKLQNLCLKNLPNILLDVTIMGRFDCRWNNLISLENAPNIKNDSYFYCGENKLTNLIGVPLNLGKGSEFDCSFNELTSLEGAPTDVWSFICTNNHLINLKHAPEIVMAGFFCGNNRLKSLNGAPTTVGGMFMCYNNPLISLEGIPKTIGKGFYIDKSLSDKFPESYIRSLSNIKGDVFYM